MSNVESSDKSVITGRQVIVASFAECGVPVELRDDLRRYVERHVPTGGFLEAVISNDLRGACERADLSNRLHLFEIVFWLYNYAPASCWGSPEDYRNWTKKDGNEG